MPDPILEEANIASLLSHFQQQGQYDNIRDWRQRIEDKEARSGHRPPRLIKVDEAVKDFRQALLTEEPYSESATALLRKLNRPKPPIVELWRLQSPANRPASLTPEQQAYVERYDRSEQERRKWCVDISTERWERWGTLEELIWDCRNRAEKARAHGDTKDAKHFTKHAETAWNELHSDLAKVGEQWKAENPELARLIVDQFTGKSWVKPVPTEAFKEIRAKELAALKGAIAKPSEFFSDAWAASPVFPQEGFYRGRLYFIAANLILKHFGLNAEVSHSVREYIKEKLQSLSGQNQLVGRLGTFDRSVESYDAAKSRSCDVAAGRVYWDLYEQLQKDGIGCIQILERHLSDALLKFLDDPDRVNDRSTIPFSTLESDARKADEKNRDNDLDRMLLKRSADYRKSLDPRPNGDCEEEQKNAMRETILEVVKSRLTPRQRSILLLREQHHTQHSIAEKLSLDPRTIRREFKKIKDFAQTLRAQHRL